MLKLNNKGWSLSTMIVCTSLILFALLVATFFAIRLHSQINKISYSDSASKNEEKNISLEDYYKMEADLGSAAIKYLHELNINLSDLSYKISYETLKTHNFIETLIDTETKKECVGYVIVDNELRYDSFIKCDSYTSEGYRE